jgi:hypothetical protein
MRNFVTIAAAAVALALGACGGKDDREKEEEVMKVEDTAFAPLVTMPQKVEDRTGAAADRYREKMNERLDADEGAPREEPAED